MSFNRIVVCVLVLLGASWGYEMVESSRQAADDLVFFQQQVTPYLAVQNARPPERRSSRTARVAVEKPDDGPLTEWVSRQQRSRDNDQLRFKIAMGFFLTLAIWVPSLIVRQEMAERKRAGVDRPADPGAGARLAKLELEGGLLHAVAKGWWSDRALREVVVDLRKKSVVFVGCTFIRHFAYNGPTKRVELPLADLLAARVRARKGGWLLSLRTTYGLVLLDDGIEPFQPLAEVLADAVEVNRLSAEKYREARSREVVVRVPWWGWTILAGAASGAVACVLCALY